jgi:hypothetical protein
VLDWNPNDPDTVKVHYDVSAWSIDQRAELSEALAQEDLAHVWEDDELIVPEALEADVDLLFERLEAVLGPFAIRLGPDETGVEFGLDEWPAGDRSTLTQALIEAEVPHRWDGTTVIVAADAEATVDDLLDGIEQGTLVLAGGDDEAVAPADAFSALFASSDRLAKDPEDDVGREQLLDMADQLDRSRPAYGISAGAWVKCMDAVEALTALLDSPDASSSDIVGAAQDLRSRVRQYV